MHKGCKSHDNQCIAMKFLTGIVGIFLCFSGLSIASVNLEIGNGVVAETSDGIYVEIDGDLDESVSGYFKGKISSGDRTGITSFAGMTLSAGIDGSIIRSTGSNYSKGNGEGNNFLRYYEVTNSGDMVTADVQISFISSGSFDERNSLSDPYYIYRYSTNWNGYGEGTSASPLSASGIHIPSGLTDWVISDNDFILFTDTEVASTGAPLLFNESGEGGDGHDVEMTFSSLTGSGNVTVRQTNRAPSNLLNNKSLTYFWSISKDAGITAFATDVSFKYLDSDLLDVSEGSLVAAYYDDVQSAWSILPDRTLDDVNNTLTVHNLDHFSRFAIGESDAFIIPVTVDVKVFLEGSYSSGGDSMRTDLYDQGFLPLDQPYNTPPWNYSGTESVSEIPRGVVDWALIQLRSSVDSSSTVATRAAFLKSDGRIVDLDGGSKALASNIKRKSESRETRSQLADRSGRKNFERPSSQIVALGKYDNVSNSNPQSGINSTSPVIFEVAAGDYYIVIHHRNHLSVMSAVSHAINSSSALYDFTLAQSQYYGNDAKELLAGVYGMYKGDANGNGFVNSADYLRVKSEVGLSGYYGGDCNLNGLVNSADYLHVKANVGKNSHVPQ